MHLLGSTKTRSVWSKTILPLSTICRILTHTQWLISSISHCAEVRLSYHGSFMCTTFPSCWDHLSLFYIILTLPLSHLHVSFSLLVHFSRRCLTVSVLWLLSSSPLLLLAYFPPFISVCLILLAFCQFFPLIFCPTVTPSSMLFSSPIIHPDTIVLSLDHFPLTLSHFTFIVFFLPLAFLSSLLLLPHPPNYPSRFTPLLHQFPPMILATLPHHLSLRTRFHFFFNPPICPSFPHSVIATSFFSPLYPHHAFLANPHLSFPISSLPTRTCPSIFNFLYHDVFHSTVHFSLTLLPPSFPPHLSVIVSCFDIFFLF